MPRCLAGAALAAVALAAAALAEPGTPAAAAAPSTGAAKAPEVVIHPFWIFRWEEVWKPEVLVCSLVLLISGVLCSAAGTGGGGVYVSVLMTLGQLSPLNAVPLSKAIVFLGSLSSLSAIVFFGSLSSLSASLRRTFGPSAPAGRPVLDLDVLRIVVPSSLVGTLLGVFLNWHAPESIIVTMLALVLSFMTCMVFRTFLRQRSEELALGGAGVGNVAPAAPYDCRRASNPQEDHSEASSMASGRISDEDLDEEQMPLLTHGNASTATELLERHRLECLKSVPSRVDAVFAGYLMIIVVLTGVLRFHMHRCRTEMREGTHEGFCRHPIVATLFGGRMELWMGSQSTSAILQLMNLSVPLWSCSAIAAYYAYIIKRVAKWQAGTLAAYQVVALGTGLLAGLLGVGGGLILSPFFLITGMEPSIAVGTSATCVLFTSASTTFQYAFTDRIIMSLALVYGLVTLVASYLGTSLVHLVQDRFAGRRSHVTLVVAAGVALSGLLALGKLGGSLHLICPPCARHLTATPGILMKT